MPPKKQASRAPSKGKAPSGAEHLRHAVDAFRANGVRGATMARLLEAALFRYHHGDARVLDLARARLDLAVPENNAEAREVVTRTVYYADWLLRDAAAAAAAGKQTAAAQLRLEHVSELPAPGETAGWGMVRERRMVALGAIARVADDGLDRGRHVDAELRRELHTRGLLVAARRVTPENARAALSTWHKPQGSPAKWSALAKMLHEWGLGKFKTSSDGRVDDGRVDDSVWKKRGGSLFSDWKRWVSGR